MTITRIGITIIRNKIVFLEINIKEIILIAIKNRTKKPKDNFNSNDSNNNNFNNRGNNNTVYTEQDVIQGINKEEFRKMPS